MDVKASQFNMAPAPGSHASGGSAGASAPPDLKGRITVRTQRTLVSARAAQGRDGNMNGNGDGKTVDTNGLRDSLPVPRAPGRSLTFKAAEGSKARASSDKDSSLRLSQVLNRTRNTYGRGTTRIVNDYLLRVGNVESSLREEQKRNQEMRREVATLSENVQKLVSIISSGFPRSDLNNRSFDTQLTQPGKVDAVPSHSGTDSVGHVRLCSSNLGMFAHLISCDSIESVGGTELTTREALLRENFAPFCSKETCRTACFEMLCAQSDRGRTDVRSCQQSRVDLMRYVWVALDLVRSDKGE